LIKFNLLAGLFEFGVCIKANPFTDHYFTDKQIIYIGMVTRVSDHYGWQTEPAVVFDPTNRGVPGVIYEFVYLEWILDSEAADRWTLGLA
jgi:hypothetical protein